MAKKILMVTGGSRGIGAEVSLRAAKQGYALCINYLEKSDRADALVKQIRDGGGTALAIKANIADEKAVIAMFEQCDRELGKLTHLVNSGGIFGPFGRIDELSGADFERMFSVNITGTVLCAREAVKRMSSKHGGAGGVIVNVSSVAARIGGPGASVHYAASKGAIDSFTWGLAQEVAGEGIRVNAVSPGLINTEIQPPGRVEKFGPTLPMKRVGEAHEVAAAILWLLSDEASYVAGANLDISGAR
jgi:NAD(P)-dependent dehydrogenase (short-subunit alcohol dehydrogenase family)